MPAPTVSILIPTLNGAQDLHALLPALQRQNGASELDLVAIDSSSDDDTVSLLRAAGFRVEVIERSEFGHGRTRNALADLARGEYLLYLSQDAVPIGVDFVERMLDPFRDPRMAGVTARVLPFPTDEPLTARTVLSAPEASTASVTRRCEDPLDFERRRLDERADLVSFNNVASCISRAAFDEARFPEVPFGEDFAWASRVLATGWSLHSTGQAAVYHAHTYGPKKAYARYREDAVFHREFFDHQVRPSLFSVAKGTLYEVREDLGFLLRGGTVEYPTPGILARLGAMARSPFLRFAQVLGQYAGRHGGGDAWNRARDRGVLGPAAAAASGSAAGAASDP